jgi:L-ornithine Nalpha-acyltransferase
VTLSFPVGSAPRIEAGAVLARLGGIEARLAVDAYEVETAQALRARAFFGDHSGPSHDADRFDLRADHLVLIDTQGGGELAQRILGTTRLLRGRGADGAEQFYSQGEFDLEPMLAHNPDTRFLEVGRSCLRADFRRRGGAEALWAGIWAYARQMQADAMIGCASLSGTVPAAHAQALSYLAQRHRAEPRWTVRAHCGQFREMDLVPAEAVNAQAARLALPALVRGYLRLGAQVGEGCVVDEAFNTTDVFIVLPVGSIGGRYISHYSGAGHLRVV